MPTDIVRRAPRAPHTLTDGIAIAEWQRLAPILFHAGSLPKEREGVLAQYCALTAVIARIDEELDPGGLVILDRHGIPRPNPLLSARNRAVATHLQLAKRLGLLGKEAREDEDERDEFREFAL